MPVLSGTNFWLAKWSGEKDSGIESNFSAYTANISEFLEADNVVSVLDSRMYNKTACVTSQTKSVHWTW